MAVDFDSWVKETTEATIAEWIEFIKKNKNPRDDKSDELVLRTVGERQYMLKDRAQAIAAIVGVKRAIQKRMETDFVDQHGKLCSGIETLSTITESIISDEEWAAVKMGREDD